MKLILKRIISIIMITGLLLLTGCDKLSFGIFDASDEDADSVKTIDTSDDIDIDADESSDKTNIDNTVENALASDEGTAKAGETPTPTPIQPNANTDLQVYTVNSGTGEIEPVTALIPQGSKITPELIVDTVVESLADQSIIIGIDNVTTEDDKVIVSFIKDKAPYSDMGSGYEAAILDAIAQSLVDNLKEYSKVIYRIENQPYVSGVFEYGINEAHLGDN
jgi:hypothetical protein